MINIRIAGTTRVCGKSQGFAGLYVRDKMIDIAVGAGEVERSNSMETAWEPTPKELAALKAGEPVIITFLGIHPPAVRVEVREPVTPPTS